MPSEAFDAIVTDPPYGVNYAPYDDAEVFFELEDEFHRLLKNSGWFVFWWSTKKMPAIGRIKRFDYVWMLSVVFARTVSRCVLGWRTFTPVLVFSKGKPTVFAKRQDAIPAVELPQFLADPIRQGDFKPTYAQACLLEMFGKNGVVLDPFAGFGSLLVANEETRIARLVVGIEKDDSRVEKALEILKKRDLSVLGKGESGSVDQGLESLPLFGALQLQ
ncbi:site-specific DNA-methyltransferase [Thermosulfurimonas sp. F29]|uniref:site-specific DNA-methyltransferase n=1 Tax=Thermosulfurimonas sp. F29 TaxID=2867247 RepID=UPI001C828EA4|nr:site-specific DNA-methyltransferase [Thermosulfurimonas sp. F29]MBX6424171.1 site-specific DNA-methyltransferase [Thermosulfurimonas sp. F29]